MPNREKPIFMRPHALESMLWANALLGNPADNLARHDASGVVWQSAGSSNLWVSGQFEGGAKAVDLIALVLTNASATTTARLRLGNSFSDAETGTLLDTGDLLIRSPVPAVDRGDGLSHWFHKLDTAVTATHWRLEISNHSGDFIASSLLLGERVETGYFYNPDYQFGAQDLGDISFSRWGVIEDSGGLVQRTLDFALGWQDEDEFETEFRPIMEDLGQRGLLYCCFDPADSIYRQARTYFGVLGRPLAARGVRKPKTFLLEFNIASII